MLDPNDKKILENTLTTLFSQKPNDPIKILQSLALASIIQIGDMLQLSHEISENIASDSISFTYNKLRNAVQEYCHEHGH